MKKLFISQPMNGKTDEEIISVRCNAIDTAAFQMQDEIEVLDTFIVNAPEKAKPLWYLGESLKMMADADVAFFAKGWQNTRGCRIEHEAAVAYGVEVLYE